LIINRRLARTLDEICEHEKPTSRERFEALLRELYILAPEVLDEHHRTARQLRATRSAVVRKIERVFQHSPEPVVNSSQVTVLLSLIRALRGH
jgi:hypothetical protein